MPIDIVVPDLGESIAEATVAAWLKAPGEAVAADEPLLELETDKATLEIVAPKAGVLSEVLVPAGEDVEVGAILARVDESATATVSAMPGLETAPTASTPTPAPGPVLAAGAAGSPGLDPATLIGTGSDGTVTVADLESFIETSARDAVSRSGPVVRKIMVESGIEPTQVVGTGRDGRVTKEDVLAALARPSTPPPAPTPAATPSVQPAREIAAAGERPVERVKMSRLRRTVASRLKEAQNTAAILTTFNEVDMTAVLSLRRRYKEDFEQKHGVRLGFMSFFAKAAVHGLRAVPEVNALLDGDTVVYQKFYDIGMAVSTDDGLVVPVIRGCDRLSFAEIETELGRLAARARDGELSMDEMSGGTFTISNGGVFGSLLSTPILNQPQSGILGLHKIEERPVGVNGEIQLRPMMYLALSYDHRLIDGRGAVTFLVRVKECIENPERLLLDM